MSTYAVISIFGTEQMVDSDGYPEIIVPCILDVLKQVKSKMKKHKLDKEDALALVLKHTDYFMNGYCDRSDYRYVVNDFDKMYINKKEYKIKQLYKFTEDDYEKINNKSDINEDDDTNIE